MFRRGRAAGLGATLVVILLLLGGGALAYAGHSAEGAPPSVGVSHAFDLSIVPLVDYLLLPAGLGCNYGHGSAHLVVTTSAASLGLNITGDTANRSYNVAMITNDGNFSIGTLTTNHDGSGTFTGIAKLGVVPPALSEVAIRLYYDGQVPAGCFSLDLVGLPFPVIISTTGATTTGSTTTARSTASGQTGSTTEGSTTLSVSPTVTLSSISSTSTTTTTVHSSTTSSVTGTVSTTTVSASLGSNASTGLSFKLVSLPAWLLLPEPLNYPFESGTASIIVSGNALHVTTTIAGSANTRFIVALRANGQNITLGTITTEAGGTSRFTADTRLDNGTYLIGIRIYQSGEASALLTTSSLVAVSIPLAAPVVIGSGSTTTAALTSSTTQSTASSTQTQTGSGSASQNVFSFFSLNLASIASAPAGYVQGSGTVDVDLLGGVLDVSVQLDHANPNTQYTAVVQLGRSNITLGKFVTNSAGDAELDAEVPTGTSVGTYATSVLVYDSSSFPSPTLVMSGGSGQVSLTSASSTSTTVQTQPPKPAIIPAGPNAIATAVANGTIPAEVQISSSGQQLNIIDHNFSVSVGRVSNTGVAITVSGQNVTGPKTFLIDINGSLAKSITSGSFEILFDGQQISEASSLSAVLAPQTGAPATYAVVQTAGGVQLLVSVPHFSTHVIEILGVSPFQVMQALLALSLPLLLGAVVVVTLLIGSLYAYRRRL